jgi:hypothetical protein
MPRRTAKINRPEDNVEEEMEVERVEGNFQDDSANAMLNLDNLRDLVFLGKLTETVNIAGFKFVVTTLSASQQRDIMHEVMSADQNQRLLDVKPITVSYVIDTINGVPLESLCEDDNLTDEFDRRLNVVMSMQASVVERVYQVYEGLVRSSNKEIGLEDLKV